MMFALQPVSMRATCLRPRLYVIGFFVETSATRFSESGALNGLNLRGGCGSACVTIWPSMVPFSLIF